MTRPGSATWWAGKIRQARRHVAAHVTPAEREGLDAWLAPPQARLFDQMHRADRRHGLDVVAWLRADGIGDEEVLIAGLLHDAGKGDTGLVPRVLFSLSQAYGPWIARAAAGLPGLKGPMTRLAEHTERSAILAQAAGCSPRTVELIRRQDDPLPSDRASQRLHLADDAS